MDPRVRRIGRAGLMLLAYALSVGVLAAPIAAEQALERVRFEDRLGTLPVEVSLCHNGVSTLDTGVLGKVYWSRTGLAGFGAYVRATGPPEAGGTLTSYVDPAFVQANAQFVGDPQSVARAYGQQLWWGFWRSFLVIELFVMVVGGLILMSVFHARHPLPRIIEARRFGLVALAVMGATAASSGMAYGLSTQWDCGASVTRSYALPGVAGVSFSNPETREVAEQVRPFIEKNVERIEEQAESYRAVAKASLRRTMPAAAAGLAPRDGERIVIAEADPQGSLVGTDVRVELYALLTDYLGPDSIGLRTISGDISSNGAVAEQEFVSGEAAASGEIPTVAVKGDHDSDATVEQLEQGGVAVPDLEVTEVAGLRVAGANDREFKTLFGGMVTNPSETSEEELGEQLRQEVDGSEPMVVLLHQPRAAYVYLGIETTSQLQGLEGHETVPWDDGIPDVPAGTVNIGHLHDTDGPWVVWNTDGDLVTWTVVDQLGTSGGVEERPTFNRFSTPISAPLKTLSVRLQYVDIESGLQTGYASIDFALDGQVEITARTDVGLPGGEPLSVKGLLLPGSRPASKGGPRTSGPVPPQP